GHEDFHTEIHPPLVLVRGTVLDVRTTRVAILGRPYLVDQNFEHGPPIVHLIQELLSVIDVTSSKSQVEVGSVPLPKPFNGQQQFDFVVRPPGTAARSDSSAYVRLNLSVRPGVTVRWAAIAGSAIQIQV